MIEHTHHVLEFNRLLDILSGYASGPLGQSNCLSLKPADDLEFIDNEQRLVSEMKLLLNTEGFLSFEGLIHVDAIVKASRAEGSRLDPAKILAVLKIAESGRLSKSYVQSRQPLYPRLHNLTKEMPSFEGLIESIRQAITPDGRIRDSASAKLKKIRRQKTMLRRDLQKKLEEIKNAKGLSANGDEPLMSIRDGRYVVPVRTKLKSRLDGIIHNYSQSRATCFFEPLEVIQDNNRLAELSLVEKEEERRILASLTTKVKDSDENLWVAQAILGKLDELYAKARFSNALNGIRPVMRQRGNIGLKEARNPILLALASGEDKTVPSEILLDRNQNLMIISGPNRGGKTVTLKTLGLLSLMAQAGLHIPAAEGSALPVFKAFMAEIGDDQDIQTGLSTFSAHIGHLKYMVEHADQDSLVIIDEPGMGTDPDEGAALAMAVLDLLSERGAFVAVSTHLNRLKTYGLLRERVRNARMEFDRRANRPTFSLQYGTPGTSYAFEIARDSGISPEIVDKAKEYLNQDEVLLNRLIDKLNRLKQKTAVEKEAAEETKRKYDGARKKVLEAIKRLDFDKKALLSKKRAEADSLIKSAREELKALINTFKQKGESSQAFARERYDQISKTLKDNLPVGEEGGQSVQTTAFRIGQLVRHKGLHQEGRILSLDTSEGKATVGAGSLRLSVGLQDLEIISGGENPGQDESPAQGTFYFSGDASREINLIGYRVADALPVIDKMIDRAVVEGEHSLRIVHGHGTGKLKEAIREHLRGLSCVRNISGADMRSGGEAVTVVDLL